MANTAKYSEATVAGILTAIERGLPVKTACETQGVSRQAHYNWVRMYPEYRERVIIADAKRAAVLACKVVDQGDNDWRASAWMLERTRPEFREVKDVQLKVQERFQELLDMLLARLSPGAQEEVIGAIADITGLGPEEAGAMQLPADTQADR